MNEAHFKPLTYRTVRGHIFAFPRHSVCSTLLQFQEELNTHSHLFPGWVGSAQNWCIWPLPARFHPWKEIEWKVFDLQKFSLSRVYLNFEHLLKNFHFALLKISLHPSIWLSQWFVYDQSTKSHFFFVLESTNSSLFPNDNFLLFHPSVIVVSEIITREINLNHSICGWCDSQK